MCSFLLVAVPTDVDVDVDVDVVAGAAELRIDAVAREHLPSCIAPDRHAFFVVAGACSCDLVVRGRSTEERAAHYRKKGWTETKIARALKQQHANDVPPGFRADVRALLAHLFARAGELAVAYFTTAGDPRGDIPTKLVATDFDDILAAKFAADVVARAHKPAATQARR